MKNGAEIAREMRLAKKLTQSQVASKMQISQPSYSAIERGANPAGTAAALKTISGMRARTDRTDGGTHKAGRKQ